MRPGIAATTTWLGHGCVTTRVTRAQADYNMRLRLACTVLICLLCEAFPIITKTIRGNTREFTDTIHNSTTAEANELAWRQAMNDF
jgi:hypothetical protein